MDDLELRAVRPAMRDHAREAFEAGDSINFLLSTDNHKTLELVFDNVVQLRRRGIYEISLLHAFTGTRTNHSGWRIAIIAHLFGLADLRCLRAAGEALPEGETFTVYRGVAGLGRQRRVSGFSWTLDLPRACWFAVRLSLPDPAVYTATVSRESVLAFCNERNEREVICRPRRPRRLPLSQHEIAAHAKKASKAIAAQNAI